MSRLTADLLQTIHSNRKGLRGYLEDLEFELLVEALTQFKSIGATARALNVRRPTLSMRILGLMRKGYKFDPVLIGDTGPGAKRFRI